MNALIFAAGLGTRLGEMSKNKPKAMVEINGKPMLCYAIEKLVSTGVKCIVVNVHHHADIIQDYIRGLNYPNVRILISDESQELLETGGGLLKAAPLFIPDEPIILYNADVLTSANLIDMFAYHKKKKGLATLMVKERETSRYFLFDDDCLLSGWRNTKTNETILARKNRETKQLAFSGIHIVEYRILNLLGETRKFSITDGYLNIAKKEDIYGWNNSTDYWFDIGTPEKWKAANDYIKNKQQ